MASTIQEVHDEEAHQFRSREHPSVAVDVVIFSLRERPPDVDHPADVDLQVLLIRRGAPPFKGMWAIPGGFVGMCESLDEAARRELAEETGVTNVWLEQLYTFGLPDRDPRTRVISVTYYALVSADRLSPLAGSDATEAAWHSVYALPPLAFDHAKILNYALTRLRYKLEYTAAAFELLPEEFTLRELQEAYMVILDDYKLDKANFRKKLQREGQEVVVPTGRFRETGGRPAELYRFDETSKLEVKARRLFP
ncbi:MAG: NUDIX hydrolase [Anaerolineae bacterium]|nr:NUDIX hydrolase [Anaerolineae bacterium]